MAKEETYTYLSAGDREYIETTLGWQQATVERLERQRDRLRREALRCIQNMNTPQRDAALIQLTLALEEIDKEEREKWRHRQA